MPRRLTNQDAFDSAMLSLLNQGHSCTSASGQPRYRGPRGKSAIGALIPDELYVTSLEGKSVRHWLAARGSEYDGLRERLGGVTPALLDELQDLHDRIGACLPSLYRHLAVAGAQRIAQSFKLSMRLVNRCAAYQSLRGPRLPWAVVIRPIPAAPVFELTPPPQATPPHPVTPTPQATRAPDVVQIADLTPVPTPSLTPTPPPELAAAPAPVVPATQPAQPTQLAQSAESDLDLIARGIARAIAAARASGS